MTVALFDLMAERVKLEARAAIAEARADKAEKRAALFEQGARHWAMQRLTAVMSHPDHAAIIAELNANGAENAMHDLNDHDALCNARRYRRATCDCGNGDPCVIPRIELGTKCEHCPATMTMHDVGPEAWLRCHQCEAPFCAAHLDYLTYRKHDDRLLCATCHTPAES